MTVVFWFRFCVGRGAFVEHGEEERGIGFLFSLD